MWFKTLSILICAVSAMLSTVPLNAQENPSIDEPVYLRDVTRAQETVARTALLREAVAERGTIEIIVGLSTPIAVPEIVGASQHRAQKAAFREAAASLSSRVFGETSTKDQFRPFDVIPFAVMTVNPTQLERVLSDPAVDTVQVNARLELNLRLKQMVDIVEADYMWSGRRAKKGKGQTIAVIDDGFDRNLPSLTKSIVHEACYSFTDNGRLACVANKKGKRKKNSKGKGASWGCKESAAIWAKKNKNRDKPKYCGSHGNWTGSTAAAQSTKTKNNKFWNGIAPKADLFLVRLVADDQATIAKAIEYILKKRKKFKISATTMSIGLVRRSSECTGTATIIEAAITALVDAGVPFFNSAGNDKSNLDIDFPGCLKNVVSVGASKENDKAIAGFSDTNHLVEMLAPADKVSFFKSGKTSSGTSYSTPAVAAGYALLKAANKKKDKDEILNAMRCTGKSLSRDGTEVAVPRIDLKKAHNFLQDPNPELRWDFKSTDEALGWNKLYGDWEIYKGAFKLPAIDEYALAILLNDVCFENFELEIRMRRDATADEYGAPLGLILVEEGKLSQEKSEDRLFKGWLWRANNEVDGFSNSYVTKLSGAKFNKNGAVTSGNYSTICYDEADTSLGGFDIYKARVLNGKVEFYLNGSKICSSVEQQSGLKSFGIIAHTRDVVDSSDIFVDYVSIRGL